MPDGLCTNCKTYDYQCTYAPKVNFMPHRRYLGSQPIRRNVPSTRSMLSQLSKILPYADVCDCPVQIRSKSRVATGPGAGYNQEGGAADVVITSAELTCSVNGKA